MGLAAPRKRRKLGQDPNNTAWASSSDSFGAKILSAQGWTPGSFLGAHDAPQADHYSTASASHIRVALKDDNLGLGARPGNSDRDHFGSGVFSDILGRLNGKSEKQIGDEQKKRADLGRRLYAEQKYGSSRFVRGGFLVGDKIENMASMREYKLPPPISEAPTPDSDEQTQTDSALNFTPKSPQTSQRKNEDESNETEPSTTESKSERRKRKLEKRARKEVRRLEKADRYATEEKAQTQSALTPAESKPNVSTTEHVAAGAIEQPQPAPLRPARSLAGSRHHVRQRYIQQKRMASMDPRSLKEILMVKS